MPWTLADISAITHGELVRGEPTTQVGRVTTDSRDVHVGDLFIALQGDRFDGHDYLAEVTKKGAAAAIVCSPETRIVSESSNGLGIVRVDDSLRALGALGHAHRRRLKAKVIAVVGSNGKTTTRDLIHHLLGGFLPGRAAIKSFNNAIGVPLTLLAGQAEDAYLVVEIGTNAPGEVALLAELAEPDLAILTSLGLEHLAGFGNIAGVVAEECSILPFVSGGVAIVNTDERLVQDYLVQHTGRVVTFGMSHHPMLKVAAAESSATGLRFKINDGGWIYLPVPGVHNALNATGALQVASEFGLDKVQLIERLASFEPPPMRCNVSTHDGMTLIDDSYNANPSSVLAAGEMLASYQESSRRILVLGMMAELGDQEAAWHGRVAEQLCRHCFDAVHLVAPADTWMRASFESGGITVHAHKDVQACSASLIGMLKSGDVVLIKASRSAQLERVAETLRERYSARGAGYAV